jgi:nucleotide-binding universal stress UspA family protein
MYKKILVPLDGSIVAECVIPHIEEVAAASKDTEVELITVIAPVDLPTRGEIALTPEDLSHISADLSQEAHKYLAKVTERLARSGIKAHPIIITGKPAESLIEYVKNNDIDLIVMATHGHSGISKWFWGSTAEKVTRAVDVPVLMIKAGACQRE